MLCSPTALLAMDQAMDPSQQAIVKLSPQAHYTRILGRTLLFTTRQPKHTIRTPGLQETASLARTTEEMVGTAPTSSSLLPSSSTCLQLLKPSSQPVNLLADSRTTKMIEKETTFSSHRWRESLSLWRETSAIVIDISLVMDQDHTTQSSCNGE